VAKVAMEVQAKSLEVTTSVLEKINILVEKAKESVPIIHVYQRGANRRGNGYYRNNKTIREKNREGQSDLHQDGGEGN
jgi:hypothetical protein